ncbi:MAG: hypothetical protein M3Y36_10315 [Actinomycetota bacterium]|nr:hypothetical protein [Actinomycetota bacterium]
MVDGPGGRGWSSWATTRLEVVDAGIIRFFGPDGRRATVVIAVDDRPVRVAGVEGSFVRRAGTDPADPGVAVERADGGRCDRASKPARSVPLSRSAALLVRSNPARFSQRPLI